MFWMSVLSLAAVASVGFAQVDVLTAQYSNNRTSSNTQETILTQANVNASQFGKLFSRTVDAMFYASPLVVSNLSIPGVGLRNVVFVATVGNTVYAFDADDPAASVPYWSVNFGAPVLRDSTFVSRTMGILSTPVIDRATNTIYVTAILQNGDDPGLFVYALDLATGALKFHSPRRITYTFSTGVTKFDPRIGTGDTWLQRAGLLLVNNMLYIGTSSVLAGTASSTQQGFIQAFKADDLSVQLANFEVSPGSKAGFWQAGRGIAADAVGNVFAAVNGDYNPPVGYGESIVKFGPGGLTPVSWFTPANWSLLHDKNLDTSAGGVTLIPGTNLAFSAGKIGTMYLLDRTNLGGLETGAPGSPVQKFQASKGCGVQQCSQHLATAFWPHATNPMLYVWDVYDSLRSYPFDLASQRFMVGEAAVSSFLPTRAGGMSVTSNGSQPDTGIVWALTATQNPLFDAVPGTLRAYKANDITQEIYNSDRNSCRDSMGSFVKFSTPIVANGKVYVNTQSNSLPVYGLLPTGAPVTPSGVVRVTVRTSIDGLGVSIDGDAACSGTRDLFWTPGSSHVLATKTPQTNDGNSPQAGTPGTRYIFTGWSDGGAISHTVAPVSDTIYTANFAVQHFLTTSAVPEGSGIVAVNSPSSSRYFDAGTSVQLTATAAPGCTFTNWSGALTGTGSSQAIVMSAAKSVVANFTCANPPIPLLSGHSLHILRNDFSGWIGTKFTVGATPITVAALGRLVIAGNSGTHTVKLVKADDGSEVGAVQVSTEGTAGGSVKYTALASAVVLPANTAYYLATQESTNGDEWYDVGEVIPTSAIKLNSGIYSFDGTGWLPLNVGNWSYGPPNLLYTVGAPLLPPDPPAPPSGTSFLTGYNLSGASLRNNFSGWVGMRLTIGNSAVTATSIGRICVGGNSGIHTVKFVNASNGSDIVGAGAQVNMTGCTPGQFKYASLASPITLTAGTSYLLASQEFQGGDRWYEQSGVSSTSVATVAQAVYSNDSKNWIFVGPLATSYVPPNFLYWTGTPPPNPPSYVLTTNVLPANKGSIVATPSGGTYVEGTHVQLAAIPERGCTFLNWSGDLSGTANTQNITMSATRAVTANFQCSAPPPQTGFITGYALNGPSLRNNYSGWVGMKITATAGLSIKSLGRLCIAGNSGTHTLKFVNAGTGADISGGSATVNLAGCTPGQFVYGPVVPFTLLPGVSYYLVSQEAQGGDKWYDLGGVTGAGAATINSSVYSSGTSWIPIGGVNTSYVPVDFQYTEAPPDPNSPLIASFNTATLRRDFTGWVGTKFTVGQSARNVSSLGRLCIAGNAGSHGVKLVQTNGIDLPDSTVSVSMASCTPGQFVYSSLLSPIVLPAGSSYYLVSQEMSGGDQWYDLNPVVPGPGATLNSAVYSSGTNWITIGSANYSYVPPNLK